VGTDVKFCCVVQDPFYSIVLMYIESGTYSQAWLTGMQVVALAAAIAARPEPHLEEAGVSTRWWTFLVTARWDGDNRSFPVWISRNVEQCR
jgi:hypothetical protein